MLITISFLMLATILIFSISIDGIWSVEASGQDQGSEVFVIYAASLIKTFEETLGSAFQKESGWNATIIK